MNDTGAVKNNTKKTLPVITISVFLFAAAGLSVGCLTAYLLRSNIYASVFHLYQTLLSELQTLEINRAGLLPARGAPCRQIFCASVVLCLY